MNRSKTEDPEHKPTQKRYFCELGCGKSFGRNTDQHRHCTNTAIHNPKKQWECPICGTSFIRFDNFRQHMKNRRKTCKERKKQKGEHGFNGARTSPLPKPTNTPIEWRLMETRTLAAGWDMELSRFHLYFSS